MSRKPSRVEWETVPIAARIEAHRRTILANGYERDGRPVTIYCVQEGRGGPIKIGRANNLATRLSSMQTGNHRRLHLLASAVLPQRLEKEIHYELDTWRIGRSEWFHATAEVFAAVAAVGTYRSMADGENGEVSSSFVGTGNVESFAVAEKEGFEPSFASEGGAMRPIRQNASSVPASAAQGRSRRPSAVSPIGASEAHPVAANGCGDEGKRAGGVPSLASGGATPLRHNAAGGSA